jgi:hypothetical protein
MKAFIWRFESPASRTLSVMLSGAKHLWLILAALGRPDDQRFFSRDCGIRMTGSNAHHEKNRTAA